MPRINWFVARLLIAKQKPSRQTWVSVLLIVLRIPILQRKKRRQREREVLFKHISIAIAQMNTFSILI